MIYVCRVDTGSRHVFDLANGIDNVGALTSTIERQFRIDRSKQILLVSGGEVLDDPQRKFFNFGFGCEESPIYLIDKTNVEKNQPPTIETPLDNFTQDLKQEVQAALFLKPSLQTIQHRSQLAFKVVELDTSLLKLCQSFFDEQYWQYQGYLALVANLDDFVSSFRKKEQVVREQFSSYLNSKANYQEIIKDVDKYIEVLSHTRLLPNLIPVTLAAEQQTDLDATTMSQRRANTSIASNPKLQRNLFSSFSSQSLTNLQSEHLINNYQNMIKQNKTSPDGEQSGGSSNGSSSNESSPSKTTTTEQEMNLLDWIKSTDPQNNLSNVIDEAKDILENFEAKFKWSELESKIDKLMNQVENNNQMREIEGLAKRLDDLKGFLNQSAKFLASQNEIADSLKVNLDRALSLKDHYERESILKDLCQGHERQLEIFKNNHANIIEIAMKICRAKLELIRVIHSRLHWVMQVQKQIADFDFQLQLCMKQLRRITVRLRLAEQLKRAPFVYLSSIKETLRRVEFNKSYKSFAKSVIELVTRICSNEMQMRKAFETKMDGLGSHFILSVLFHSLNEKIEPFLTTEAACLNFDNDLPQIDDHDLSTIKEELMSYLNSRQDSSQPNSDTSATNSSSSSDSPGISSSTNSISMIIQELNQLGGNNNSAVSKSDSPAKMDKDLLVMSKLNEIIGLEDNKMLDIKLSVTTSQDQTGNESKDQSQTEEVEKLKAELEQMKHLVSSYQGEINEYSARLKAASELSPSTVAGEIVSSSQQACKDSKPTIDYSKLLGLVSKSLIDETSEEESETALQEQLEASDSLDEKDFLRKLVEHVKACRTSHKKEMEEMRASMQNLKVTMNAEKQIMFNEAIKRATKDKDKMIEEMRAKQEDCLKRVNELEVELREKKHDQNQSNTQETVAIQTEPSEPENSVNETSSIATPTTATGGAANTTIIADLVQTENVNEAKAKLRELMLQEKVSQLEKQLAMFSTLPVTNNYYETIQINSCNVDDLVLAVYSDEYGSYRIIHKTSNYLHFVHSAIFKNYEQRLSFKTEGGEITASQSTADFSLEPTSSNNEQTQMMTSSHMSKSPSGNEMTVIKGAMSSSPPNAGGDHMENMFVAGEKPAWFVGKVLLKEFCIARKENNRFKVPSGTRFYRVKLKPYPL